MKYYCNPASLLLAAIFVFGCAAPVHVETSSLANWANYHTYAWVDVKNSQTDNRNVTGLASETIHRVANTELAKKGWQENSQHPDVLLSYDVLVERTVQRQSQPVYTQPFSRIFYNPYFGRWATVYYPPQFIGYDAYNVPVREGTLTLTMTDAQSDKTLWQAWTTETMQARRLSASDVEAAMKRILKKLDVRK